jgi:hypothetical protein
VWYEGMRPLLVWLLWWPVPGNISVGMYHVFKL